MDDINLIDQLNTIKYDPWPRCGAVSEPPPEFVEVIQNSANRANGGKPGFIPIILILKLAVDMFMIFRSCRSKGKIPGIVSRASKHPNGIAAIRIKMALKDKNIQPEMLQSIIEELANQDDDTWNKLLAHDE